MALPLSPSRNASRLSGGCEASQAASDLRPGCVEVKRSMRLVRDDPAFARKLGVKIENQNEGFLQRPEIGRLLVGQHAFFPEGLDGLRQFVSERVVQRHGMTERARRNGLSRRFWLALHIRYQFLNAKLNNT
jgi:hypothetical protein